jgi:hypothetical protein
MKSFHDSTTYRKFVNARDAALEKILRNSRKRIADHLNGCFNQVITIIQGEYPHIGGLFHPMPIKSRVHFLEQRLVSVFEHWSQRIANEIVNTRKKVYTLAYLGEVEAISQATQKKMKYSLNKHDLNWAHSEPFENGQQIVHKIDLYFNRLRRQMMNDLEVSIAMDDDTKKALGRIIMHLPKKKSLNKGRALKKVPKTLQEAQKPQGSMIDFNMVDQETWDQAVSDYQDEYIPVNRSPDEVFDATNPWTDEPLAEDIPSEDAFYGWEVEQDTTHDFVQQVRDGQNDAANENGINDFIWIAILDNHTCDDCCGDGLGCANFNGKLFSEVEKLTDGDVDSCPAHFNCRCTAAPVTDDLELYDISDTEKEFDQWLAPNG